MAELFEKHVGTDSMLFGSYMLLAFHLAHLLKPLNLLDLCFL